ncbi:MAG TPA: GNAT family N-acetyltransferase [Rhizomicrobium sp.]|jgi:ribosomal protein S18 acetylase RimI-like enzyme
MNHVIRDARIDDLPAIVAMLADDELGRTREDTHNLEPYAEAFRQIDGDTRNRILVAESDGAVVGCFQISFVRGLSRRGAMRALIEGVRVAAEGRGRGIGEAMMRHAVSMAKAEGCALVQLTSDKSRTRAHAFYERLGFKKSHEGFKLEL